MEKAVPSGGQGAVEFNDSSQANSVESRLSLLRSLVEDVTRSGETSFTKDITVSDKIWRIQVTQVTP